MNCVNCNQEIIYDYGWIHAYPLNPGCCKKAEIAEDKRQKDIDCYHHHGTWCYRETKDRWVIICNGCNRPICTAKEFIDEALTLQEKCKV